MNTSNNILCEENSKMMKESIQILRDHFPGIHFKNVSLQLCESTYKRLQIDHMNTSCCLVAEKNATNSTVFAQRDNRNGDCDLLLMYKGAYRILHGGSNVQLYTTSLTSFFTNPYEQK